MNSAYCSTTSEYGGRSMNKRNQNLNSYTESDSKSSSIIPGDRSRFLASKKAAMKKRILEIINLEERAFSSKDFR